jgi:WD40 repeat protein
MKHFINLIKINRRFSLFGLLFFLVFGFVRIEAQKPDLIIQTGHSDVISGLAFSPDGTLLASSSYDGTVKIWEVKTGNELRTIVANSIFDYLSFSGNGKILYGGKEKPTLAWDVVSGKAITMTNIPLSNPALTGDGRISVSACWSEGTVIVSDATTKKEIWKISDENQVSAAAISLDGKLVSSGSSIGNIKIWDVTGKKLIKTFRSITDSVTSIAISPDDKMIVTGSGLFQGASETDSIKLWNVESGALVYTFNGNFADVYTLKFTPDGKLLISGTRDSVTVWDIVSRKERATLSEGSEFGESYAFANNGQTLLRGGTSLAPWLSPSGWVESYNLLTGKSIKTVEFEDSSVLGLNNTGKLCAISYEPEVIDEKPKPSIKVADTATGKTLLTLPKAAASAAFSPDSKKLFTFSNEQTNIWSLLNKQKLKTFPGGLRHALSPNGILLALAQGNQINVYNTLTGKRLSTLTAHGADVTSLSFTSNSKFLLSGSLDASTKIWNAATGEELASLIAMNESDWLVTTPEGFFDGSPAGWKHLTWRFNNNTFNYAPVEAFFKEFYYPGLLHEIMEGKTPKTSGKDLSTIDIRQPEVKITEINNQPATSATDLVTKTSPAKVKVEITDNINKGGKENFPSSSGANDVRLFRNGSLVKLWKEKTGEKNKSASIFDFTEKDGCRQIPATKDSPPKAVCETEVKITAGKNEFTAYAFNHDNVKSNDAVAEVSGAFPKHEGTLYVLGVGVNEYANTAYNLNYAVPDAERFSAELQMQQEKLRNYKIQPPLLLTNKQATKANILYALERFSKGDAAKAPADLSNELKEKLSLIKPSQPEDAIVVYFSGHGFADKDRFYLIPHDLGVSEKVEMVTEQKLINLRDHSLSDQELESAFESIDAGQFLFVIDACNSGQALETSDEKRRGPMNSRGLAQLAYEKGMYILTASESFQVARETSELGHGLMTYSLLEGLEITADKTKLKADTDGNSNIFEREWFNFAVERVPQLQEKRGQPKPSARKQPAAKKGSHLVPVAGDKSNRALQTPRVFYRRETGNSLLIAKP